MNHFHFKYNELVVKWKHTIQRVNICHAKPLQSEGMCVASNLHFENLPESFIIFMVLLGAAKKIRKWKGSWKEDEFVYHVEKRQNSTKLHQSAYWIFWYTVYMPQISLTFQIYIQKIIVIHPHGLFEPLVYSQFALTCIRLVPWNKYML